MEYPWTRRVATLDFITHVLDHVATQGHNFKAARAEGGEGFIRWSTKVLWNRFQNEVLYAKIYLEKRKIFAAEIEALRAREQAIIMTLTDLRLAVQKLNTAVRDAAEEIRSLLDELGELLGRMSSQHMSLCVLKSSCSWLKKPLCPRRFYCRCQSRKVYKEKRTKLDELNLTASVFTIVDPDGAII